MATYVHPRMLYRLRRPHQSGHTLVDSRTRSRGLGWQSTRLSLQPKAGSLHWPTRSSRLATPQSGAFLETSGSTVAKQSDGAPRGSSLLGGMAEPRVHISGTPREDGSTPNAQWARWSPTPTLRSPESCGDPERRRARLGESTGHPDRIPSSRWRPYLRGASTPTSRRGASGVAGAKDTGRSQRPRCQLRPCAAHKAPPCKL